MNGIYRTSTYIHLNINPMRAFNYEKTKGFLDFQAAARPKEATP